jgi:hypothetical protein
MSWMCVIWLKTPPGYVVTGWCKAFCNRRRGTVNLGFVCCVAIKNRIRKPHECVFWVEISHEWLSWPGNPWNRRSSGFPRPRKPRVWYFHSIKHTSAVFCLSHDTKWEHLEADLARIVANFIQKFKTHSLAVTLQMMRRRYVNWSNDAITSQWRYADRSDDVTWARRWALDNMHDITEV